MTYIVFIAVACAVLLLWSRSARKRQSERVREWTESATAEGRAAALAGRKESECPYNDGDGTYPRNVPIAVLAISDDGPFKGRRYWWIAGYRQALREGAKPTAGTANARSSPARAAVQPPNIRPSIGVLFEIDNLGSTPAEHMFYGLQARRIFMKHVKPNMISPAVLWAGDTQKTLDGDENRFCIAVTGEPAALQSVVAAISGADEAGLATYPNRFRKNPVDLDLSGSTARPIHREPLTLWFSVDADGVAILPEPVFGEDVELCRQFGWEFRTVSNT